MSPGQFDAIIGGGAIVIIALSGAIWGIVRAWISKVGEATSGLAALRAETHGRASIYDLKLVHAEDELKRGEAERRAIEARLEHRLEQIQDVLDELRELVLKGEAKRG